MLIMLCLSSRRRGWDVTVLLVYTDNVIVVGDNETGIMRLKEDLATEFEIKGLGELRYFLGIEVVSSSNGVFIYQ